MSLNLQPHVYGQVGDDEDVSAEVKGQSTASPPLGP